MKKEICELAFIAVGVFTYQIVGKIFEKASERDKERVDELLDETESIFKTAMREEAREAFKLNYRYKVTWYQGSCLQIREEMIFNTREAAEEYRSFLKEKRPYDLILIDTIFEA